MPDFAFTPPPQPSVPVNGTSQLFPVRRIFCVGRNYAAHAQEMGFSDKEPPFFFTKPADALVMTGATIPFPPLTHDLHHEIEMVLAIGKDGTNISPQDAPKHIFGLATGIDLTRRDLQIASRQKGQPWDWGKAFDNAAPITPITPLKNLPQGLESLKDARIWLALNNEIRQDATLAEMIWGINDIISFCSQSVALKAGDLIYTGTPAGVGQINPNDTITGGIDGLDQIKINIKNA